MSTPTTWTDLVSDAVKIGTGNTTGGTEKRDAIVLLASYAVVSGGGDCVVLPNAIADYTGRTAGSVRDSLTRLADAGYFTLDASLVGSKAVKVWRTVYEVADAAEPAADGNLTIVS